MLIAKQKQIRRESFPKPVGFGTLVYCFFFAPRLQVSSVPHIARMVLSNPIGFDGLFTASLLHSDYVVAATSEQIACMASDNTIKLLVILTATFPSECNHRECCRIVLRALIRSDSLVYGLMWGSKEAQMTRVGAEAVDSNRPPCLPSFT